MIVFICPLTPAHAQFRHACVREATCLNQVGGYECRCAKGYAGDGLTTGSGCRDVDPPVIVSARVVLNGKMWSLDPKGRRIISFRD